MFREFASPDVCHVAWIFRHIKKIWPEPEGVQLLGLFFEHHLIGGCRGGKVPKLPKSVGVNTKGQILKPERDILKLIEQNKKLLFDELKYELVDVQPEWIQGDLIAHVDCTAIVNGKLAIVDIKYTETAINDRHNGWGQIEFKANGQPIHYVHMSKEKYGYHLPYYYWIFGKTGWVRLVQVLVLPSALDYYEDDLDALRRTLQSWSPQPANDYNKCRLCPYWDMCEKKTTKPEIEQIQLESLILI